MAKTALAIDIGASNIRVALISKEGKVLQKISQKTNKKGKSGTVLTNQIIDLAESILKKNQKIAGIGVSSIGPLDYKIGGIKESPNIPYKFVPIIKPLRRRFSLPVYLYNDCLAAVWGEKIYGAGKKVKNLVYITISTGIGGGAIVDNHLLFGRDGNAVEIGHFFVEEKYHLLCGCLKGYGHWEGCCSGNNLPRFIKVWAKANGLKLRFPTKTAKDIFDAARKKEKVALKFIEELAKINGRAISTIIVAYDPELITLGGAVVLNNKEFIIKPLKKYIDHFLRIPLIKTTPLKENTALLGGAALVFYPPKT
jgi:glucokinase